MHTLLSSLSAITVALAWICLAGAVYDLCVIRPAIALYRRAIVAAEASYQLGFAFQLSGMLPVLTSLERAVSFVTCWALVKDLGRVLGRRIGAGA